MGSLSNESFEEFLDSLKRAGVVISNEQELRERLAEVQRWRYAFATLAANGESLGIRFENRGGATEEQIRQTFSAYQFPESWQSAFAANLKTAH